MLLRSRSMLLINGSKSLAVFPTTANASIQITLMVRRGYFGIWRSVFHRSFETPAAARKSNADRFEKLCLTQAAKPPRGWRFKRAELYEERFT